MLRRWNSVSETNPNSWQLSYSCLMTAFWRLLYCCKSNVNQNTHWSGYQDPLPTDRPYRQRDKTVLDIYPVSNILTQYRLKSSVKLSAQLAFKWMICMFSRVCPLLEQNLTESSGWVQISKAPRSSTCARFYFERQSSPFKGQVSCRVARMRDTLLLPVNT